MCHHLEAAGADSVDDLAALLAISDLQLLLQEDGCLLVGRLDDARHEDVVRRRRRRMKEGQEVYGLRRRRQTMPTRESRTVSYLVRGRMSARGGAQVDVCAQALECTTVLKLRPVRGRSPDTLVGP